MKAILIDKASAKLSIAIKNAEAEIKESKNPTITCLEPSQLVLKRILSGEENLHDPNNSGDMLILEMASWS